ncbi:general secretion pathway protein C [Comamonas testosteroni]|uniref:general secretion pathway protein C n=1 Tax=Comamonas testosteroni TaxID=285 RepID=UPI0023AB16AD|nr:general secretion pathway protein C [Comamonas testosteroni]WEE78542.1 general secretion pathway protein C [Comamonas testosteroni]
MRLQSFNTGQGLSMPVKLTTLLLWAIAAAVVVFWTLRFVGSASEQLPLVVPAQPVQANAMAMAKALGAVAAPAAAVAAPVASRYALLGVLAGHETGGGAAVIAVEGKGSKAVRVGEAVEDGVILQSLAAREARLGPANGPTSTVLQLPRPPMASFN